MMPQISKWNIKLLILLLLSLLIQYSNSIKISLFDSTKIKDDLNWSKISFKETQSQLAVTNSNNWLKEKISSINTKNDIYGWKESSFSLYGGDDVWRIHFVCDLNQQNIQNWLFTPLINTKQANRVTLNLTFTIRECEHFPIKQVVKNCREKFELYYEEIHSNSLINDESNNFNDEEDSTINHYQDLNADINRTSLYFLNKIKQLRFRETFVSDTGLRYYNSVVDRQKQASRNNRPGESSINVELREIPLTPPSSSHGDSFIRFGIRDTGACISLLSVEVSYVTCPQFQKYGIIFPETPTGRDLTDLIQVNGKCPLYTSFSQQPKAICTAKGEWLITDQNLSNKCLCLPGYEIEQDGQSCSMCPIGYYKSMASNEVKCLICPENSWSSQPGAEKCECLIDYYRENESNISSGCKAVQQITANNLDIKLISDEKTNISISRTNLDLGSNIQTEIKCYMCNTNSVLFSNMKDECDSNCFISSFSNDWITVLHKNLNKYLRMKLVIKQKLNDKELTKSLVYVNLNQAKHVETISKNNNDNEKPKKYISCELNQNSDFNLNLNQLTSKPVPSLCLNMSINLNDLLDNLFSKYDLVNRLKRSSKQIQMDIYSSYLVYNNDYESLQGRQNNMMQLKLLDSINVKNIIWNNISLPLIICNLFEMDVIKLEFNLKSSLNQRNLNNYQKIQDNNNNNLDWLDIFTIDIKLSEVCVKRESNKASQYISSNHPKDANLKHWDNNRSLQNENNYKVHIVLPIVLSFVFVALFILAALFFRRVKYSNANCKQNEKSVYNCDRHLKKFMPSALSRSCSTKCIDCNNVAANSSSSSSSTSSSSPSTICTTSQIIDRSSKLYYVDPHTYEDPAMVIQEFAQEISPIDIKIESVIGGGEFGDVCKGKLKNSQNVWATVAIKTLKVGSSDKNRCDFLTEASIMAQFHHENIICLEGVVTQSHPYMIITEFMENGSLDTFLRLNSWRLNIYDLVKMLKDIANGMKYLSQMNFVHRDLAARNILVNKSLQCKVADFGLSREIEGTTTEGVYWTKGGKIPVRWTAPEAISHTKFTCSSDVWSFGVVAWEVMSFGERPYWNWSNTDVIKAVDKGFRLLIPTNCPQIIYTMMLDCWETDRLKRPRFKQIVEDLDVIIKSKKECLYSTINVNKTNSKQASFIDTNRPNFAQLTNIQEWLISINLEEYANMFLNKRYLNLWQVLNFDKKDLTTLELWDEKIQNVILESLKCIQFELNFQNGFLV